MEYAWRCKNKRRNPSLQHTEDAWRRCHAFYCFEWSYCLWRSGWAVARLHVEGLIWRSHHRNPNPCNSGWVDDGWCYACWWLLLLLHFLGWGTKFKRHGIFGFSLRFVISEVWLWQRSCGKTAPGGIYALQPGRYSSHRTLWCLDSAEKWQTFGFWKVIF